MTILTHIKTLAPHAIALFISAIFLDSLQYKFTNHPNTETIFGILNTWASTIGFPGLFAHTGLFSQYVIGSAEFVAAALLLLGIVPTVRFFQSFGALLAFAIMTGAVFFHLFTPLGIDPNQDGGGLFVVAVLAWLGSLFLLVVRRKSFLPPGTPTTPHAS